MILYYLKLKKEVKNFMDCFDKEEEEEDVMEYISLAERLEKKIGIKFLTFKVNGQFKIEVVVEKFVKKKQGQC